MIDCKAQEHALLLSFKGAFGTGDPREEDCGRYEADVADASKILILGIKWVRTSELLNSSLIRDKRKFLSEDTGFRRCTHKSTRKRRTREWQRGEAEEPITLRESMSPMINLDPLHSPRRLQMMEDMKTLSLGTWNYVSVYFDSFLHMDLTMTGR